MTTVRNIYDYLDQRAPFSTQMEGDNSGLQVGDFSQEISRAMLCLDCTPEVISQATQLNCELIIAHHPVMFHARRELISHDPAWLLARHGISCIAAHTPLDACTGGVSDTLAHALGLEPIPSSELFRLCDLPAETTAIELAALVKSQLNVPVQFCDGGQPIHTVALCGGSGGGFLGEALGHAQAYITGEVKHSDFLLAKQHGITMVTAGHFATEVLIVPVLATWLREHFPQIKWHIAQEQGPFYA
ncbi:MAG: Nif3-like dinuclear metal center hexameric protein [Oscillospiraceae bacterium]|nr:Nif3-like dinuclear metal center hexameric protein [Oscillospiraceae bacterium]